jgi:hypothetical protein
MLWLTACCGAEKLRRRRFLEAHQHVGSLDLDAFAAVELDLRRGLGLRQNPTGHELSGFFKQ